MNTLSGTLLTLVSIKRAYEDSFDIIHVYCNLNWKNNSSPRMEENVIWIDHVSVNDPQRNIAILTDLFDDM